MQHKPISELNVTDIHSHPVWEFCNDLEFHTGDETVVRPVFELPVADLGNRVVGTSLQFSNGVFVDGLLSNIDLNNHTQTEHFLCVSLYRYDGSIFHLARYHDFDYQSLGPNACAAFFGLTIEEIFPIQYDIRSIAVGVPRSTCRTIPAMPEIRLDNDELIRIALSS